MNDQLTPAQREALAVLEQQKREHERKRQLVDSAYQESRLTLRCVYCGSEGHSSDECGANEAA